MPAPDLEQRNPTVRVREPHCELPAPADALWFTSGDSHQGPLDRTPAGVLPNGVGR